MFKDWFRIRMATAAAVQPAAAGADAGAAGADAGAAAAAAGHKLHAARITKNFTYIQMIDVDK